MNEKENLNVYLHISNSGINFEVINSKYGPQIEISSGSFGNMSNIFKIYTDTDGLKAIGEMFLKASELEYNKEYCHAAKIINPEANEGTCCTEDKDDINSTECKGHK